MNGPASFSKWVTIGRSYKLVDEFSSNSPPPSVRVGSDRGMESFINSRVNILLYIFLMRFVRRTSKSKSKVKPSGGRYNIGRDSDLTTAHFFKEYCLLAI